MIAKTLSTSQRYASLNEVAGKLAEFCQALYPLLVAHADDFGRQAGDEFTVKHAVCPTSPRKLPDVTKALTALHAVGLIEWYDADGRKCIQIQGFERHQQGLHKRTKTEFPDPSGKFPEIPSEGKRRELKGTEEKGREQNGAPAPVTLSAASENDPTQPDCKIEAFVTLWNQTVTAPLPQCRGLSDKRKAHIRARLSERPFGEWLAIFQRVNETPFCEGPTIVGGWPGWIGSLTRRTTP